MTAITIQNSITNLNKNEWDAMVNDNVFSGYGWLKTVEETFTGDVTPIYILCEDSKEIVGGSVCYLHRKPNFAGDIDDLIFGRFRKYASKLSISFLPTLVCCPFWCYGDHFFVRKDINSKTKRLIKNQLLDAIENLASDKKLPLSFINVMNHESHLINLLNHRGYNRTELLPLNYLDIEWPNFSGYLQYLKDIRKKTAKMVRNEINRNRQEKVRIVDLENIEIHNDRLYELINLNYLKYSNSPFIFNKSFLIKLKLNVGEKVTTYVSFKKEKITGVCVLLKKNRIGYLKLVGIDRELAGNDFTYFNLAYYKPIRDAITANLKRLCFGQGVHETKIRRGCRNTNVYLYYKSFNKIKNNLSKFWFFLQSTHNQRKVVAKS
jgi:predicted N-acyltransferase